MDKLCAFCNTQFKDITKTHVQKYCSKKCCKSQWHIKNKNSENQKSSLRYAKNSDNEKIKMKQWYCDNKDSRKETMLKWRSKNKQYLSKYCKNKKEIDIYYKIACNIRTRLWHAFKGNFKTGSAVSDLGCSIEELKQHLESRFQPDMSWNNYGRKKDIMCWEVDHILPLVSFDLTNPEHLKKACHYTNLQPLWAKDNLSKGVK